MNPRLSHNSARSSLTHSSSSMRIKAQSRASPPSLMIPAKLPVILPAVPVGKPGIGRTALHDRVVDAGCDAAGRARVHTAPVFANPCARQMQLVLDEGLSRRALFDRERVDVAEELVSAEKVLLHSSTPKS